MRRPVPELALHGVTGISLHRPERNRSGEVVVTYQNKNDHRRPKTVELQFFEHSNGLAVSGRFPGTPEQDGGTALTSIHGVSRITVERDENNGYVWDEIKFYSDRAENPDRPILTVTLHRADV